MSDEKDQVIQDITKCIVAVFKEHKQCDIIKVSELEKRQHQAIQEASKLMNEIEEQVSRKSVAIKDCDLEGYDLLTSSIIEQYKEVFSTYVSALLFELRLSKIKQIISEIPDFNTFG